MHEVSLSGNWTLQDDVVLPRGTINRRSCRLSDIGLQRCHPSRWCDRLGYFFDVTGMVSEGHYTKRAIRAWYGWIPGIKCLPQQLISTNDLESSPFLASLIPNPCFISNPSQNPSVSISFNSSFDLFIHTGVTTVFCNFLKFTFVFKKLNN